jgi:hypothetical protein
MTRKLTADDTFPLVVTNENELDRINGLLHDLLMELPPQINELFVDDPTVKQPLNRVLGLNGPKMSFVFTDQEMYIKKDWVSEFRLNVFGITSVHIQGKDGDVLAEPMFNKLKYAAREQELIFHLVECNLRFRVSSLRLELEHVA